MESWSMIGKGASAQLTLQPPHHQCAYAPQHILSDQTPLCLNEDSTSINQHFEHPTWSHRSFCIDKNGKEYCTHTTSHFRTNHGLSIISTPAAAEAISSAFPFTNSAQHVSEAHLVVRAIPGKGFGLTTSQRIPKGSPILLDAPRIIASAAFPAHVQHGQGALLFKRALERLPDADRQVVLSLDKSLGGSAIEDIMKTNAFACQLHDGGAEDAYMCLFPSVARINHACRPNAHARFIPHTLLMEVKALQDIPAGAEISISYGRVDLKFSERQKLYKEGWNFTCTCAMCTASDGVRKTSDTRRARFAQLSKMLDSVTGETYDAQQIVAWEQEVMEISGQEGLDVLLAPDYERLSYVYAGHGMRRDAKVWAEKARDSLREWKVVEGGPKLDLERVEELLESLGGE
ncbi:SET domain-containing protein [Ophiobolus disseminans]|uniref:SET domain-containing protein n=1 Tax=Ophiobolus disseminans TaxID=1469910 RepID=A0A6A7A9X7_9PLEO|nr:SET domain-containing protein [Ophiobolus disseminans]